MTRTDVTAVVDPCIYCNSVSPRTKREHVMSQALGTFEQNWTLDCVCDDCNHFFSKELELSLGRDSVEAYLRVDLGLKPASAAAKFRNKRMKGSLNDPGPLDGALVVMRPSEAGDSMLPVPVPQVAFRRPGESWRHVPEWELTETIVQQVSGEHVEIRIIADHGETKRLVDRLAALGIAFQEHERRIDLPISEEKSVTVVHDFFVDTTMRRAAAKIGFNYSAKVLGAHVMRRPEFDAVRRFVRFGEEPEPLVSAQRRSILVGPEAATTRTHTCALGWDAPHGQLVCIVSLFNEVTYGIRMCRSESDEVVFRRVAPSVRSV